MIKGPDERSVPELLETGIVILDKPPYANSHEVAVWVRRILHVRKSGHAGTLDPMVTGVLPVGLNRATALLHYLTKKEKVYVGIIRFSEPQTLENVQKMFDAFTGEIVQLPPRKCAVKRVPRKRTVYYFNALEIDERGKDVLFEVKCQAGTYVRALVRDIAYKFGVHTRLMELRRTAVGHITEDLAHTLQELVDAYWFYETMNDETFLRKVVQPVEKVMDLPTVTVNNNAILSLTHGAPLYAPGVVSVDRFRAGDVIAVITESGTLVEVARAVYDSDEMLKMEKGKVADPVRVILHPEDLTVKDRTDSGG